MTVSRLETQQTPAAAGRLTLTDEQRAAVEWADGPLMVLAGAGTGKTTVIVERVRHLLEADPSLQPENLLVLTYNVRAAAELADRLEQMLGLETASRLWIDNFHSFGHRVLSEHRAELGLARDADVLDQVGQRLLLRGLRPQFGHFIYHSMRDASAAGRFADVINRAKDELVTPEHYMAHAQARREAWEIKHGSDLFEAVVEELRQRDLEGRLWQVRSVRREMARDDQEAATRAASREARRDTATDETGRPLWWNGLTREQERFAKQRLQHYLRDAEAYEVLRLLEEAEAYAVYQAELRRRGLLDFGEQQLRTIELLTDRPNIQQRYQAQFRHVLVDEFQDANMAQILLLELVGRGPDKPDNVVVVGDDDQSIYRFRGASYAAFERFRERFGEPPAWAPERPARTVASLPLLANRRSTPAILAAASRLIDNNRGRLKSEPLQPTRPAGEPVDLVYASDEADEADMIVSWIRDAFDRLPEPRRWSDVAILYRKHRHRDRIVDRLRREDIPYAVVGGAGLFSVPEVRDVEAALRVAANPEDSAAFVRLLSAGPWRLDAGEVLRLTRAAAWDGRPVFHAAREILRAGRLAMADEEPAEAAAPPSPTTLWADEEFAAGDQPESVRERHGREHRRRMRQQELDDRLRVKLARLFELFDELVPRGQRDAPFAVLEDFLVRTNLLHDLIAVETPDAQRTVLAIARLMRFVADWQAGQPRASLADFIEYLDLYQEVGGDLDMDTAGRVDVEGVQLMTVYQAKGLEYQAVVVPRLVEGQFPDTREERTLIPVELLKQKPPDEFAIAEERRLLFVAMTRAKGRLLLTALDQPQAKASPSRFCAEIEPYALVERRAPRPEGDVVAGGRAATATAAETTVQLLKLMPVPQAHERRFQLRRRAVELIGSLEALPEADAAGRLALTEQLVEVAQEAAGAAEEARRHGLDPITLNVLARHAPAGRTLLELAPLPQTFSHSQMRAYTECPLAYAFDKVYRIPVGETKPYFEFGHVVHAAFEDFTKVRRDAIAAGFEPPGYETLKEAFDRHWNERAYADEQVARHYSDRADTLLRRFFERELDRLAEAVGFEVGFTLEIDSQDGEPPIRFYGVIDRIDRHPDGSIEITDYKTGRARRQQDVDEDDQLSAYALAVSLGAVRDPQTGERLPPASKLTLYFTETDQALSTTRSAAQLDDFRQRLIETARRIRAGDFSANPDQWRCGRCDYRLICPSRYGAQAPA